MYECSIIHMYVVSGVVLHHFENNDIWCALINTRIMATTKVKEPYIMYKSSKNARTPVVTSHH